MIGVFNFIGLDFPTPNRRGLQYSGCGNMKDLNAEITSIGTIRLILLSAPVVAYAFISWLANMLYKV